MKKWYEELFTNFAETYEKESYTKGTPGEVDFIEQELKYDKNKRILDVGCGTGRHAIELAKRGYRVTGIDLSRYQLEFARKKARTENVVIEFIQMDARELNFKNHFDLIIMLCGGAFPLMETDEMNFKILGNIEKALKKDGKLIFTTLNALFPLCHSVEEFHNTNLKESVYSENKFDLMTFREYSTVSVTDDLGKTKKIDCNERYYTPPEISWLLKSLHFQKVNICGCKLGKYSRKDMLSTEDFEMLVIAEK